MPCITIMAIACCVVACRYQYWLAADGQQSKAQLLSEQCNEELQQVSHDWPFDAIMLEASGQLVTSAALLTRRACKIAGMPLPCILLFLVRPLC